MTAAVEKMAEGLSVIQTDKTTDQNGSEWSTVTAPSATEVCIATTPLTVTVRADATLDEVAAVAERLFTHSQSLAAPGAQRSGFRA